ncbi:TRAP transporter TatT component family protein [Methylicorpusculum sp.]|uniref:TRAP transporter TatT component family protein n=1 Tax=Methylicorpusculum sp. TaxID=2713644 RepID=UPI002722A4D6|nr:TRAP transporter TatT component family protein [Methylicorpusculum sp.]MDO8843495.1 TRAP transporter TatT component family protein [Methylicorpusculum sp.]
MTLSKPTNAAVLLLIIPFLIGCVSSALQDASDSFASAILDQEDVAIVREGLPAYLLMTDGLIESNPNNADLLMSGAKLYAFYASSLVSDNMRSRKLTEKARSYAQRALCLKQAEQCKIDTLAYDDFKPALDNINQNATNELYTYGLTWAAWLQAHSRDWNAIADRPKIEALFERIVDLDESIDAGRVHYYLGLLRSQLSPALGGKPELAKTHFERAIELSQGKDLAVKVALARNYARMIFDRALHDNVLHEVLQADPKVSGLTLSNTMAQQEAQHLLDESSSYFQE